MPSPLHILVLGAAPHAAEWRAAGHTVTEAGPGRLRAAWRTWRGAGRGADVVLEIVDGRPFLTPLWGWLDGPRVVSIVSSGTLFDRVYHPLLYGDAPVLGEAALDTLREAAARDHVPLREVLSRSETAKAAGLAAATLGANAIQLLFTILFTRLLGVTDYGSLAVLVSAYLILLVAGAAVQVAAARDAALGALGTGGRLASTMQTWEQRVGVSFLLVAGVSILLRQPVADLIGAPEHPWGAAAILPTGVLWLGICLQRGLLQGLHAYAPVARSLLLESFGRLGFCLAMFAADTGVTGVFAGMTLTLTLTGVYLARVLRARLGPAVRGEEHPLAVLFSANWRPMLGLLCLGALQNVDIIVVKHQLGSPRAGSYAAAGVAAKTFVWVAIGIGLHLLPEATRRAAAGLDPRPVLVRAMQIAAVIAVPVLLVFAVAPSLVLRVAFGEDYTNAASALVVLGAAMTLLAVSYLTTQYLIALGRRGFLWVLVTVALVEPLMLFAGDFSLLTFALIVLAVQATATAGLAVIGLRGRAAA
jgi:O-antigen/teichoic acid export membrane protein